MRLTGSKGEITASFTYGTYGELLSGDNRLTKFLYNGRCGVTTDDNGLYYMRQRYYNPEVKRFVNQDVLAGSLGNSQSLNRYSYVQGNPVSYTDPFGLSPLSGEFTGATYAHVLYAVLGCIPGPIGVAANLADGALYFFEGDYMMVVVCGLGAVTMGTTRMVTTYAAKATETASIAQKVSLLQRAQRAGFVASLTTAAGGGLNLVRNYEQARRIVYKESDLAQTARPGEAYSKEELTALGWTLFGCLLSSCGIACGSTGMVRAAYELNALNRASANIAMADIASKGGSNAKGLIDGAPEPEVQNFIERFRKKYPGREYKSGHKLQHSDGRFIEIDFETDNVILEFKRGNGKGLTRQIIDRQDPKINPAKKVVIGIPGSKMSRFAQQDVEKAGGLMSNDIDLILELIKPD